MYCQEIERNNLILTPHLISFESVDIIKLIWTIHILINFSENTQEASKEENSEKKKSIHS